MFNQYLTNNVVINSYEKTTDDEPVLIQLRKEMQLVEKLRPLEQEMHTAISHTAAGRWKQQHETELDAYKWSVAHVPLGVIKHNSVNHTIII